ncbi:unnamed protein product [Symbiodinium sp. CCMP2592]|nr:unnamed protein product [Symbiodinium sp. CCMP2592]
MLCAMCRCSGYWPKLARPILRRSRPFCLQSRAVAAAMQDVGADSQSYQRLDVPPANASQGSAEKFASLVSQELEAGATVELLPVSSEAAWHLLRALCIGKRSAEFEVHFAPQEGEEDNRSLRVLARSGPEWVDVSKDWYTGYFVSKSTQGWKLARKLEMDLREKSAVAVHTFVDALPAALTILQALAAVPGLAAKDHALVCTATAVDGDSATRLIVHACTPRAWLDPPKMAEGSFIAYPPGSAASEEDKRVFRNTVHARLQPGSCVVMQCRGQHAAWHALEALALKGLVTAEVEVLLLFPDVVYCQKFEARRVGLTGKVAKLAAEPFN